MVATRENDRMTKETNGTKEQNSSREQNAVKEQTGNKDLSRPTAMSPSSYRRGTNISQWGHEPFRRMREEFDRMFEQFFGNWPTLSEGWGRQMHWGLDMQEDDGAVVIRAEAPGFEPGDFDVQVRGDQLMLHATHKAESHEKQRDAYEWQQQEFYRSVSLPCGTDNEKVDANYRNGVLTVTLAKAAECKGRHITVKA